MDALRLSRLQIDFDRGVLKFLDQLPGTAEQSGVRIPIQIAGDGTPRLMGEIGEGRQVSFLIDTGAHGNSLSVGIFDDLAARNRLRPVGTFSSATIVGEAHGNQGWLDSLMVGPFIRNDLRFARVRMADQFSF